jgi:hypothetical protein
MGPRSNGRAGKTLITLRKDLRNLEVRVTQKEIVMVPFWTVLSLVGMLMILELGLSAAVK